MSNSFTQKNHHANETPYHSPTRSFSYVSLTNVTRAGDMIQTQRFRNDRREGGNVEPIPLATVPTQDRYALHSAAGTMQPVECRKSPVIHCLIQLAGVA